MTFNPALDGLLDLLAEVVAQKLDGQSPTDGAGIRDSDKLHITEYGNGKSVYHENESKQASNT